MGLSNLFSRTESLIGVDIGASSIKLVELDTTIEPVSLVNIAAAPVDGDIFSNNAISKPEKVSELVSGLLEANGITEQRAVIAMPGPSVFTKKIKMPKTSLEELFTNIQFEAGNFIPHNIDAVKLDFHVIGESAQNQYDVLVVAVKNEIVESYIECFALAGLDVAIVDVDYFALQNMFELCYPEEVARTAAIINMGARYSSINICKGGDSLFTGDIAVGGKLFTEGIAEAVGVSSTEAEKFKKDESSRGQHAAAVREAIDQSVEYVAVELNRQLSFFWNASGSEEGIDKILLSGGGSCVPRLRDELSEKTGIDCEVVNPLRGIDCGEGFDQAYLNELAPLMSVCVGLGLRQPADRILPDTA